MDSQPLIAHPYPRLAEVDLQLPTRRRLEPNRRARLRLQLPSPARNPPLNMTKADRNAMLGGKLLAHHVGVAVMPEEPFAQPVVQTVELRSSPGLPIGSGTTLPKISSHRIARAPELPR